MSADKKAAWIDGTAAAVMAILGGGEDATWWDSALCAQTDPDEFFPEKGGSTRQAKQTCMACPVRAECLEYALEHDERHGLWGGLSERERRRLVRGEPVAETDHPRTAQADAQKQLAAGRLTAVLKAGEKPCLGCGDTKALDEFPWCGGKPRARCHDCVAAYMRKWRAAA